MFSFTTKRFECWSKELLFTIAQSFLGLNLNFAYIFGSSPKKGCNIKVAMMIHWNSPGYTGFLYEERLNRQGLYSQEF